MSNQIWEDHIKNVIRRLIEDPKYAHLQELNFLLVGRSGVGKSSTINSLLNRHVADTDRWEKKTVSIEAYALEINGIKCKVFDTPGLCDDLETKGNDDKYIHLMRARVPNIHCLLYISPLYETRIARDEKKSIELISKGYGLEVWNHSIVVFTFASDKKYHEFQQAVSKRAALFKKEISQYAGDVQIDIPCIPIDNHHPRTPDGKIWREKLVYEVFKRIQSAGFTQFFLATLDSVAWTTNDGQISPNTNLPPPNVSVLYSSKSVVQIPQKESQEIRKRVLEDPKIMTPFIEIGKALGAVFGGVTGLPSLIGGAIGAIVGLILWITGSRDKTKQQSKETKS